MTKRGQGGDAQTLRDYWSGHGHAGPSGGAERDAIAWGTPGDFDRCVAQVSAHMTPEQAKGYCNLRHHDALGYYPGTHARMERGKMAADLRVRAEDLLAKVGPHGYSHGWIKDLPMTPGQAASAYVSTGWTLSEALRKGSDLINYHQKLATTMDALMRPAGEATTLHRGLSDASSMFGPPGSKVGQVVTDAGYTSASLSRKKATAYALAAVGMHHGDKAIATIRVGPDDHLVSINELNHDRPAYGEREHVLPRGSSFRVISDTQPPAGMRQITLETVRSAAQARGVPLGVPTNKLGPTNVRADSGGQFRTFEGNTAEAARHIRSGNVEHAASLIHAARTQTEDPKQQMVLDRLSDRLGAQRHTMLTKAQHSWLARVRGE